MPISDCEVRDPRVRRTRELLKRALETLLKCKSLDEVSVGDITDQATLNRATFYDHYADKFALYEAIVAGGFHQILHERNIRFDGNCPAAVTAIVLAVCDYLTRSDSGSPCFPDNRASAPLLDAAITSAVGRVLLAGVLKHPSRSALSPEMIASMASWAIYGAVKEWLRLSKRQPAEKFAPMVVTLVLPLLHLEGDKTRPLQKTAR